MKPGYGYFDHDADIGVVGRGPTVEAAFAAAAEATFAIMTDLSCIHPEVCIQIEFEEGDLELALVEWINQLLGSARAEHLALGTFALARDGARWRGRAWGEPWRPDLERGVEVKGATLTMLAVSQVDDGWEVRCVVDV